MAVHEYITQTFKSETSDKLYFARIEKATGRVSCTCPGWVFKKKDKQRGCKHTREMLAGTIAKAETPRRRYSPGEVVFAPLPPTPKSQPKKETEDDAPIRRILF
jgi:hypothetical protein